MALSVVLLLVLLVIMNVEVVARYLFNSSTLIADEYGGYLYTWIVLLGAVHLLRSDRYLTMTASGRPAFAAPAQSLRRVRRCCRLGCQRASASTPPGCWSENSYLFGTRSIQPTATPLVLIQAILPLGFGLLCLAYVEEILRRYGRPSAPPRR